MRIDLNNRKFKPISNTKNGEVSIDTIFHYKQSGDIVSADYKGGNILKGNLFGKVINKKYLYFMYHHINVKGNSLTGICKSYPEVLESGKMILKEYWQWTCLDYSEGESTLIEI